MTSSNISEQGFMLHGIKMPRMLTVTRLFIILRYCVLASKPRASLSRGVPSVLHGSWPGPWLCLRLCDRPSFEKALRTPHAAPPCILRLSVAPRAERAIQLGLSAEELGKRLRASHGCIPLIPCCWSASRIHTLQRLIISTAVPQRREGAAHQSLHRVR